MQRRILGLAAVLAILVSSACTSSSTPSAPSDSMSGTWSGSVNDPVQGPGTVHVTIAQNGNGLSGTWQTTYGNVGNNSSGSFTGAVSNSNVSVTLTPSDPTACPFNVTLTLSGTSSMSGSYSAFNCTVAVTGSINLTKQ